jgi:carboxylesterase
MQRHNSPEAGAPFSLNAGRTGCLLIHGFTGTPFSLRKLGERLYQHGFTVNAPLLPGHGSKPADLLKTDYRDWIDTCQEQLDSLKKQCDSVFIIGLSMGGTLALYLSSLQAVSGVVALSAPIERSRFRGKTVRIMKHVIRYWPKWRSLIKPYRPELGYRCYPLQAVEMFLKVLSITAEQLDRIVCPVLLMHSRYDRTVSSDQMELLCRRIASEDKKCVMLDTSKHAVTLSSALGDIETMILEFIERNGS